jgi:hypothetical protein
MLRGLMSARSRRRRPRRLREPFIGRACPRCGSAHVIAPCTSGAQRWLSPESGLLYQFSDMGDDVRAEVFWAGAWRGIRSTGRSVYDRLARSPSESRFVSEQRARVAARDFDDAFRDAVDAKLNGASNAE